MNSDQDFFSRIFKLSHGRSCPNYMFVEHCMTTISDFMDEMCLEGQWLMHWYFKSTWKKEQKYRSPKESTPSVLVVSDAHFGEMWSSQSKNQPGSASANCECWPWNPDPPRPPAAQHRLGSDAVCWAPWTMSWWVIGCECCVEILHGMWLPMPLLE